MFTTHIDKSQTKVLLKKSRIVLYTKFIDLVFTTGVKTGDLVLLGGGGGGGLQSATFEKSQSESVDINGFRMPTYASNRGLLHQEWEWHGRMILWRIYFASKFMIYDPAPNLETCDAVTFIEKFTLYLEPRIYLFFVKAWAGQGSENYKT